MKLVAHVLGAPLRSAVLLLCALIPAGYSASAAPGNVAADAAPAEFPLELYRALGATLARDSRLADLGWDEQKVAAFVGGVKAAFDGERAAPPAELAAMREHLDQVIGAMEFRRRRNELMSPAGRKQFIRNARKDAGLRETDSGLCYRVLNAVSGERPRTGDMVVVSFEGSTADDMAPAAALKAERLRVNVADLPPGLAEGVQMMAVDSEMILLLPPELSFGDGEWPAGIERGLPLVFRLKLHEIVPAVVR